MHATKAAVEEGMVAGGYVVFLRASLALDPLAKDQSLGAYEKPEVDIIRRAAEAPIGESHRMRPTRARSFRQP